MAWRRRVRRQAHRLAFAPPFARLKRRRVSTNGVRIPGIAVAIVGAVVVYFCVSGSHSLVDQASQTLTGRYTKETMTYMTIGIIAVVGGGLTALAAGR